MKKNLSVMLLVLILGGVLAGCAQPAEEPAAVEVVEEVEEPEASAEPAKPYRVGLVPPALVSPFYIVLCDTAKELADQNPDIELIVQAPTVQTAIDEQVKIVEDMIESKMDLIAIATSNWDALAPVLIKAREAGIEVINVDRVVPVEGLDSVSMLGSDEIEGGQFMAQYVIDLLGGEGQVAVLTGVAGSYHAERRQQGFEEVIKTAPGIEIVSIQPANWQRELGMTTMENILQAHPGVDVVWGHNDNMALGALTAIQSAGLQDTVKVVGYNGDQEALEKIKANEMMATCKSQPVKIAEAIVLEVLPLLIAGKKDQVQSSYPIHVVLTTAENVDEFLTP